MPQVESRESSENITELEGVNVGGNTYPRHKGGEKTEEGRVGASGCEQRIDPKPSDLRVPPNTCVREWMMQFVSQIITHG